VMRTLPLTIVEPGRLTLLVGALPKATLGEAYSYTFFTVGQTQGSMLLFDFVGGSGETPPGLSINRNSGELSGTPMLAGSYTFSVQVIEGTTANPPRDTASVTLVVEAAADSISITPTNVPDAVIGQDYIVTFEARQGVGPFNWTVDNASELPPGLTIEAVEVDGIKKLRLSGKPTALPSEATLGTNTGGVVSFLVKLDDAEGRHTEQSIALRVIEAPVTDGTDGTDDGGCGCNTTSNTTRSALLAPLLLGMALVIRGRRRS
jgi:large repetitive protein